MLGAAERALRTRFFSVEVLTVGGLVRYLVLFVMDLKTRRVDIAGITCGADGPWMAQVARNLTDAGGFVPSAVEFGWRRSMQLCGFG
jgi:hypothetical protein